MDCGEDFSNCSPCTLRDLTKPSVVFCPVCEESLCNDCKEHHKVSKSLRGHQLLNIEEYRELPPLVRNINQFCETHGDILEFFCQFHDEVCCKRCATTLHLKCSESVQLLHDLIGNMECHSFFDDVSTKLSDLETNTITAICDRERNMEDLSGQKQAILQSITLRRQNLNEVLDKLEARVKNELDTQFDPASTNISRTLIGLKHRHALVVEMRGSIQQIKQCQMNSKPFLFICKRAITSTVENMEKEEKDLYESKAFFNTSLEYRFEDDDRNLSTHTKLLGEVLSKVEDSPRFTLQTRLLMRGQISSYEENDTRNVKLSLLDKVPVSGVTEITGCSVNKDGSIILVVSNTFGECQLIKINNKKEYRKNISNGPFFDVVNLEDDIMGITTGSKGKRIDLFKADSLKGVGNISTKTGCYGATVRDQFIIYLTDRKKGKIKKVCTETGLVSSVKDKSQYNSAYVASDENRLYLSDPHHNTVTCIDNTGTECWAFNNSDELKSPRGITIDTHSNLYVAGYEMNNVVMISPDGQSHSEVLSSKDGIDRPLAIYFDKDRSQLLVCNLKGPVFLFQVS